MEDGTFVQTNLERSNDCHTIHNFARWDPITSEWSEVGGGVEFIGNGTHLQGMGVFDLGQGQGESLYIWGGTFRIYGALRTNAARWDGQGWTAVGDDIGGEPMPGWTTSSNATINTMAMVEDREGPALYAGGRGKNTDALGHLFHLEPAWNMWVSADAHFDDAVNGLLATNDALYVTGAFRHITTGLIPVSEPTGRIAVRLDCPGGEPCYANCDGSTTQPILNVDDFTCFINEFAAGQNLPHEQQVESYANCDGSTTSPVLTVDDFTCFINAFAAGCP